MNYLIYDNVSIIMKIDILSDIHLEMSEDLADSKIDHIVKLIKKYQRSNILCLNGNIGVPEQLSYKVFLTEVMNLYEYVLLIAGSHEYYSNQKITYNNKENYIRLICQKLNVTYSIKRSKHRIYFLQKEMIEINGYIFAGCTLNSYIDPQYHYQVTQHISDYSMIWKGDHWLNLFKNVTQITPDDRNEWYYDHVKWINEEIICKLSDDSRKVIMLTHFPPLDLMAMIGFKAQNPAFRQASGSNLCELLKSPIITWIYGHTQIPFKYQYHNEIWLQSNSIGYDLSNLEDRLINYMTLTLN